MKKIILLLLVICLGVCAFFALLYYRLITSPEYSLDNIVTSIAKHDYETFSKYMDIDSVIKSMLEKANCDEQTKQYIINYKTDDIFETIDHKLSMAFKTAMGNAFEIYLRDYMRVSRLNKKPDAKFDLESMYVLDHFMTGYSGIKYRNITKINAHIGIGVSDKYLNKTLIYDLFLTKAKGYWQLKGVTNIEQIADIIVNNNKP